MDVDGGLSMGARVEITKKYATAYCKAAKKDKGQILGQVCAVTGWTRDNARRRLVAAGRATKVTKIDLRKRRAPKYTLQARGVLERVWAVSGGQCGKYLAVSLPALLDSLEAHGELVDGLRDYSPEVRAELEAMSAVTIDRYLHEARSRDQLRASQAPNPVRCCAPRSRSARPATRWRPSRASSRETPSHTAARRSEASSRAP